jgi:hypothetical protein
MAENFTTKTPLEIIGLDDDTLIQIFSYLDHHSQLNAMLVCCRFESLIGQTAQFFNKYKLVIDRNSIPVRIKRSYTRSPKIINNMYFGRYFGDVHVNNYSFTPGSPYFSTILETFEIIGQKFRKVVITNSKGYRDPILNVFQMANNVKKLIIECLTLNDRPKTMKYKTVDPQGCTFPELTSLELISIVNIEIILDAFNQVKSLRHLQLSKVLLEEWETYQPILLQQEDLRSLELDEVVVSDFEWRTWNIEKLSLKKVMFPRKEAFQNFVAFIKSPKCFGTGAECGG